MPTAGPPQEFKDSTELTGWLKMLLWTSIVLSVIAIWFGWLELQILADANDGLEVSTADAWASNIRQGLIGLAQTLLFIVTGIVFLMWIYRACHNARTMAATKMNFTPGWAVGWYFIPIASIYKPFKAMEEIFRVSKNPSVDLKKAETVPIVIDWWGLWIFSAFIGQFAFRASLGAEKASEFYRAALWTFAGDIIDIPLCLVAISLVGRIFEMQSSRTTGVVV